MLLYFQLRLFRVNTTEQLTKLTKITAMNKLFAILFIGLVIAATLTAAQEPKGSVREKRGYHQHGHGHGPGAGGGARGPIYFCGWVGSKEGSRYHHHG